jgi:hypothetical protein
VDAAVGDSPSLTPILSNGLERFGVAGDGEGVLWCDAEAAERLGCGREMGEEMVDGGGRGRFLTRAASAASAERTGGCGRAPFGRAFAREVLCENAPESVTDCSACLCASLVFCSHHESLLFGLDDAELEDGEGVLLGAGAAASGCAKRNEWTCGVWRG